MDKVYYAELTPREFRERMARAPIAYLPLGTLEWHGEHLPLGSDGIQSSGFFALLAAEVGGIVLPMLFLGPDRVTVRDSKEYYGMDIFHLGPETERYDDQQLPGSAYWAPPETFHTLLAAVLKQLARAGFRIVVGHGHGPSGAFFLEHAAEWQSRFGLTCFNCWGGEEQEHGLGIQIDHAAANETSLVMALRPELVQMDNLPGDPASWPVAVSGIDPRTGASAELGQQAIKYQLARMSGLLREALAGL